MYLRIQKLHPEIIQASKDFFGEEFCNKLEEKKPGTFEESLVARYLLEKNKDKYYSISHKKSLVFVGAYTDKIGVDIEIIRERDASILETFSQKEYTLLGSKNWQNFYFIWTAKEAIIKFENLVLDDMQDIVLINVTDETKKISEVGFSKKFILKYRGEEFSVISGLNIEESMLYSVCY